MTSKISRHRLPTSHILMNPAVAPSSIRFTMHVSEIWRYPVKSLKGERLKKQKSPRLEFRVIARSR